MPYEWQSALAGKGIPTVLSVCRHQSVCMCLQVLRLTFYVILYLKGGMCTNTVIINRVFLFPGGDEAANMPPMTIYPVIRPHYKHTVSSGCFDGICLQSKQSEHGMEPETKIGR